MGRSIARPGDRCRVQRGTSDTRPREWAERFFHVRRWTEMPRGGHFAAMEEPELLASDLRESFRPLRRLHVS
jgi:pimeloyl-ACP methyl ester carboxylesterase